MNLQNAELETPVQNQDLVATIQQVVVGKLGASADEVTLEANLVNDLGGDSLDTVEILMELEKELGISIPDEATEHVHTVQDLYDVCKQCQR